MDHDIPASQRDRHLPMIINLRGDEELVDEFTWDAEHVMEFLGIKRSRLTQISGKELRVARIRRDRYLRPIYRESDVKDYQEWTRATATHQSSSRAIEQAIDSLDDRFSDLMVVLQEKLLQLGESSTRYVGEQFQRLEQAEFTRFLQLRQQGEDLLDDAALAEKMRESSQRQLEAQSSSLQQLQAERAELRGFLASFHQDLRALAVAQQTLKREWELAQEQHTQQLQVLHETLAGLQVGLVQVHQEQQRLLEQTKPQAEKVVKPERKRTRRLFLSGKPAFSPNEYGSESAESSPQSNP